MNLTSLSGQLAGQSSLLAERVSNPPASPSYLDLIRSAKSTAELAEQVLKLCVQQSRDAGHTWQEIGDLLGVTRQAAFQRFGKPIDPRTGEPMDRTVHITDAAERAVAIVTDFLEGRMDDARKSFNAQVLAALTDEKRGSALATVAGLVGEFEGFGEGEVIISKDEIMFYLVRPEDGVVIEKAHDLEGKSVAKKVIIFPGGKGSSVVQSDGLYQLLMKENQPAAMIIQNAETVLVAGAIIMEIPLVDKVDPAFYDSVKNGDKVRVDATNGIITIL